MSQLLRWTSADLEAMPDDSKRREIIDGELYVSKQPHYNHQLVCVNSVVTLSAWNTESGLGQVNLAPGLIFAEDDDVAPDVIWISNRRLAVALTADGKLHSAPELVVEVLLPGESNERRDREAKLKLYSRRGVEEYWILDWRTQSVEVYRREQAQLRLIQTLYGEDNLESPMLPGFSTPVAALFQGIHLD
jgi:Uma2 family endonuclease